LAGLLARRAAFVLGALGVLALPAALAPGSSAQTRATGKVAFAPCSAHSQTQCGWLLVPLDRSGRVPGRVRLFVEREGSVGPEHGTVFALTGGPGDSAAVDFSDFYAELRPILRGRELVIFDQRGTGRSGELECPSMVVLEARPEAQVAACAKRLGARAAFYSTQDSVADLEAVRKAVHAPRISMYGISYGTLLAEEYAIRYPARVDRLVLDSTVPPGPVEPFDLSMFGAVKRVLANVCRAGCGSVTPDPSGDVARLIARLRRHGLAGYLVNPRGHRESKTLNGSQVMNVLIAGDLTSPLRAAFPAAVRSALRGDAEPMLQLVAIADDTAGEESDGSSNATYVATSCEDAALPWSASDPVAVRRAAAFRALDRVSASQIAPFDLETVTYESDVPLCLDWPFAGRGPAGPATLPAGVHVLFLSGSNDLRTPTVDALKVAVSLPHAKLLVVPDVGHDVLDSTQTRCPARAMAAFFAGRPFRPCGPQRLDRILPIAPPDLSRVAPLALVSAPAPPRAPAAHAAPTDVRPARLLGGVRLTLGDVVSQIGRRANDVLPLSDGGLRSGSYTVAHRVVKLQQLSYISGLTLSGSFDRAGAGSLEVEWEGRPVGTLTIVGWRVRGVIGGSTVDTRFGGIYPPGGPRVSPTPLPVPGCAAALRVCVQ
jgi:pimeloyl-ACP methyl ester carboxylesterase